MLCYCFSFFENGEKALHHQKKHKMICSDTTAQKKLSCQFMYQKSYVCYILLQKFGKSQLQVPHLQNSSQLYHNIFTPIKHGAIKEVQNQHRHEGRHQQRSQWAH
jgi:hypothetical protein